MNITVIRDLGNKVGPGISESLLTTTLAGIERGRVEIDTQYYDKFIVTTSVTDFDYLPNGSFIGVRNQEFISETVLLTGISINYSADQPPKIEIETERLANGV